MRNLFLSLALALSLSASAQKELPITDYYTPLMIDYDHDDGRKFNKTKGWIELHDPKIYITRDEFSVSNAPTGTMPLRTQGGNIYRFVIKYVQTVRDEDIYSIVERYCTGGDLVKWDALIVKRNRQILDNKSYDVTFKLAITNPTYYDPQCKFSALLSNKL